MATSLPVFANTGKIDRYTDYMEPGLIECYVERSSGVYELVGYTNIISPVTGVYKETAIGSFLVIDKKYLPGSPVSTPGGQYVAPGGGGGSAPAVVTEEEGVPAWLWAGIGVLGIMLINKKK